VSYGLNGSKVCVCVFFFLKNNSPAVRVILPAWGFLSAGELNSVACNVPTFVCFIHTLCVLYVAATGYTHLVVPDVSAKV
jgi:hypothetical protein